MGIYVMSKHRDRFRSFELGNAVRFKLHFFPGFKKAHGSAGVDKEWHHIVSQRKEIVAKFGPEAIHNTKNLVAIPKAVHTEINKHYGRLRLGTNRRNRDWVGDLSFEEQYKYGKQKMEEILNELSSNK